jgi:hypothetical protein
MKRFSSIKLLGPFACAILVTGTVTADNIALNKTVTLYGDTFGDSGGWAGGDLADASTIVDGIFLPEATQWNQGTVFWLGTEPKITIDLEGVFVVDGFGMQLQVDNNDGYLVEYHDISTDSWLTAWASPWWEGTVTWGMETRTKTLPSAITTDMFRIGATDGDNYYSISEFQAYGSPVPEPSTVLLLALSCAAGVVGLVQRKRRN